MRALNSCGLVVMAALVACRAEDPQNAVLQAQIDDLQLQIADLQAQVAAGSTKDSEQDGRLDGHDADILEIAGTDVGAVLTQVQDHEAAITDLEDLADTQGDDLEAMQGDLGDLDAQVSIVETHLDDLESAVTVLDSRADTADTLMSALQTEGAGLATRLTIAETTLTAHASALAAHTGAIGAAEIDIAVLESDVSGFETDVSALEGDVSALETDVAALEIDVSALETDVAALEAADASLASDVAGAKTAIATHTTDISGLKSTNTLQDTTISAHTSDLASAKTTNTAQDTTISAHTTTLGVHTTTLSSYGTTIGAHTSTLGAYGTRIGDVELDVTDLQADVADLELQGKMQRRFFPGDDGTDNGVLGGRFLTFTKARSNTALRVTYYDNLRVNGSGACYWEVLFNGQRCTAPGKFSNDNYSGVSQNRHIGLTTTGYCTTTSAGNLNAGTVTLTVQVSGGVDCYTGWTGTTAFLEAQEILP